MNAVNPGAHGRPFGIDRGPLFFAVLYLLMFTGCKHPEGFSTGDGFDSPITAADITYAELAERYNEKVASFDTLWCRTSVDIEWFEVDDDGGREYRHETGEGKFILRRPGETALSVEKIGRTFLWAGSDDKRYWLLDMVDGDNKTAYVGTFDRLGEPGTRGFPLPVRPDTVPYLLGVMPLPTVSMADTQPPVDLYNGQYLVELPGMRLLIDPGTFRPARVDLTDGRGFSVLTSKLAGLFPVEVDGVPSHRLPTICDKAEVYVSGYESRLTVAFDFATADPGRVRDPMFDFETLVNALSIDTIEPLDR